jgi:hypothetical protein
MNTAKPTTIEDWRSLPWLLSPKQVRAITGLTKRELAKANLKKHNATHGGKYRLLDVAGLCGVRL